MGWVLEMSQLWNGLNRVPDCTNEGRAACPLPLVSTPVEFVHFGEREGLQGSGGEQPAEE